jgi:hypothetical protein
MEQEKEKKGDRVSSGMEGWKRRKAKIDAGEEREGPPGHSDQKPSPH